MDNKRKWLVKRGRRWVDMPMADLKVGDVCKIYEPTGEPIYGGKLTQTYTIIEKPYRDDNGVLTTLAKV